MRRKGCRRARTIPRWSRWIACLRCLFVGLRLCSRACLVLTRLPLRWLASLCRACSLWMRRSSPPFQCCRAGCVSLSAPRAVSLLPRLRSIHHTALLCLLSCVDSSSAHSAPPCRSMHPSLRASASCTQSTHPSFQPCHPLLECRRWPAESASPTGASDQSRDRFACDSPSPFEIRRCFLKPS